MISSDSNKLNFFNEIKNKLKILFYHILNKRRVKVTLYFIINKVSSPKQFLSFA